MNASHIITTSLLKYGNQYIGNLQMSTIFAHAPREEPGFVDSTTLISQKTMVNRHDL